MGRKPRAEKSEASEAKAKNSSKTYEEPPGLSIITSTQTAWLNVTLAETETVGFITVKECFTQRGLPFVVTVIGGRGSASVITATKRLKLFCTVESQGAMLVNGVISSKGTRVAGVTDSNIVYLWDISNWNDPRILYAVHSSARTDPLRRGESSLCLSPSGALLMVQEKDSPIFVWAATPIQNPDGSMATTARIVATFQGAHTRGLGLTITSSTFSNDPEEKLLFASFVGTGVGDMKHYECCIYDIAAADAGGTAGTTLMYPSAYLRGHEARICSTSSCVEANLIFTGTCDSKAMGWVLDTYRCSMFFSHPTRTIVQHIQAIPGGAYVATAASDGFVRIWGCHPFFSRNTRGFAPLVARLNPPPVVCKRGAYMMHMAYEHANLGITVIWRCHESAPSVPEPVADGVEDTYAFIPVEGRTSNGKPTKRVKVNTISAAISGSSTASLESSLTDQPAKSNRFLVVVRYPRIPCLVARYRSDVSLMLFKLGRVHHFPNGAQQTFIKHILAYVG